MSACPKHLPAATSQPTCHPETPAGAGTPAQAVASAAVQLIAGNVPVAAPKSPCNDIVSSATLSSATSPQAHQAPGQQRRPQRHTEQRGSAQRPRHRTNGRASNSHS